MSKFEKSKNPRRRPRQARPVPDHLREYLTRREMLAVVPLSMTTIHMLERRGLFPKRIVLTPTTRVVWKRREIDRFMEDRTRKRDKPEADALAEAATT